MNVVQMLSPLLVRVDIEFWLLQEIRYHQVVKEYLQGPTGYGQEEEFYRRGTETG